uniref:Interleukin-18 n=1 Tax=Seriola dumerili TaxID=41447 RepID=A0A3B4V706_SERDU
MCFNRKLQSNDDKILLLHGDTEFQARFLSIREQQQCQNDCIFNIHIYNNSSTEIGGRAVMLYVKKNGKMMVACCNGDNGICPKQMDLPKEIKENKHEALFIMNKLKGTDRYMFESTMYQNKFLGFEPLDNDPNLNKLVLRSKGYDEPDDSCEVNLYE